MLRLIARRLRGAGFGAAALATAGAAAFRLGGRTWRRSPSLVAFTPQATLGAGLLAPVALALGHRRSAALLGGSAAAVAAAIAPRARVSPQPVPGPGTPLTLRILSANCLKGQADPEALVALVRAVQPDVLALQEQNRLFIRKLERAGLFDLLPHRVLASGARLSDAGLVSRFPLHRIAPELPSDFVAAVATLPDGRTVPLISFHPLPPVGRSHTRLWTRSLQAMPAPVGDFDGAVVCGDFNATHDHPEFRALLAKGWRDAAHERGVGLRPTWTEFGVLHLAIDHILAPPGAAIREFVVHRLLGSDHRPVFAAIALPQPAD